MSDKAYFLTESDRKKLSEVVNYVDNLRRNASLRSERGTPSQAPEVYVALTPAAGIAAAAVSGVTTDNPVKASCLIHQILPDEVNGTTNQMMPVTYSYVDVYNITSTAVPGSIWVLIVKDKYGNWIVAGVPGSGGGGTATPSNAVQITGALVTPGGTDVSYYPATEQRLDGTGAWSTGAVVRAINTGTADPKTGKTYPSTYVGLASDGVTKCYAIKAAKTQVVSDVSLTCSAGTLTQTLTKIYVDVDQW